MEAPIERVEVSTYRFPTDCPESDGTLEWSSTTLVLAEARGGGKSGLGYSYATPGAAQLIHDKLAQITIGADAMDIGHHWVAMRRAVRNIGRPGIASSAISALDIALWDLKARLLDQPLSKLLGRVRGSIPAYGSGGFTSYPLKKLCDQLRGWADEGFAMVKMKIGREPGRDVERVRAAREAIGSGIQLFVDANGAYSRKQALKLATEFEALNVCWFEEPVSSDDLEGLKLLRDRVPAGIEIAAGEYGYDSIYFRRMLESGAVDVLQADATRCAGITGFLKAGALCDAFEIPLSAHTAPSVHVHPCCALERARHVEYFHDHERIEKLMFDGAVRAAGGLLQSDASRPGLGLDLKRADAEKYLI